MNTGEILILPVVALIAVILYYISHIIAYIIVRAIKGKSSTHPLRENEQ